MKPIPGERKPIARKTEWPEIALSVISAVLLILILIAGAIR